MEVYSICCSNGDAVGGNIVGYLLPWNLFLFFILWVAGLCLLLCCTPVREGDVESWGIGVVIGLSYGVMIDEKYPQGLKYMLP